MIMIFLKSKWEDQHYNNKWVNDNSNNNNDNTEKNLLIIMFIKIIVEE